jgi:hypothetical protein
MAACATQPAVEIRVTRQAGSRSLVLVLLAICLPILAGLAWHIASDNPAWPLMRSSMNLCTLGEAELSPVSTDGLYRAHVVQVTLLGRFTETLVFVAGADEPWPLSSADPNRAVLQVAGLRSLDAVTWQPAHQGQGPVLQFWFAPGAARHQIHHMEHSWRGINIQALTNSPAPGAERLDY